MSKIQSYLVELGYPFRIGVVLAEIIGVEITLQDHNRPNSRGSNAPRGKLASKVGCTDFHGRPNLTPNVKIAPRWAELALKVVELIWHFGAESYLLNLLLCIIGVESVSNK